MSSINDPSMKLLLALFKVVNLLLLFSLICDTHGLLILCSFPNWAVYRTSEYIFTDFRVPLTVNFHLNVEVAGIGQYTADNVDPKLCTHILYYYAMLDKNTLEISVTDNSADIDNKGYEKLAALKTKNPQLKTMITLGGWEDANDGTDKYSRLTANISSIDTFLNSAMAFLQLYKFDGLNLDYDYSPNAVIKDAFSNLLKALRNAFKAKGYLLSAVVPASASAYSSSLDGGNKR